MSNPKSFLTGINLNKNQLTAVVIDNIAGDASSPAAGQLWYNTSTNLLKYYNGTSNIDPLARANHSGTQLSSTISNLASTVQAYTLNLFAAPTASVAMGGYTITGLGTPSNSTDAATKGYVDTAVAGLSWKTAVAASTTAALTVTYSNGTSGVGATLTNAGTQAAFAVDGYSASVNDRILVKNQSTGFQNGIYVVTTVGSGSTNWVLTRATDSNTSANVTDEAVYIENGTTLGATGWVQTAVNPTLGSTSIAYSQFSGSGTYAAGSGLTLTGNSFSISSSAVTNAMLANSSLTVTAGTGMSGGGSVSLGGSVTITNAGVTSNVAGTGISVSGSTGAVTVTNTGVTSIVAGTGISVSGATGAVTITNTGSGLGKFATTIGDGSTTSYTVTHSLSSLDVVVAVYLVSGGAEVQADVIHASTSTVTIAFATAPATNTIRVVCVG